MTVSPASRPRDGLGRAGLMASLALFVSVIGIVHRPVRVIPAAILVALVAAVIGGRPARRGERRDRDGRDGAGAQDVPCSHSDLLSTGHSRR